MRAFRLIAVLIAALGLSPLGRADDSVGTVKKAVERSTLNRPDTKPFHLKAVLAPTRDSDRESNRTGEVEIWWASPTQWRREVRSPEFHQVFVTDAGHEWQKNDGDYFPDWLRQIALALIDPVPNLDEVLPQVGEADVKKLMGITNFSWMIPSTDGNLQTNVGAGIAIADSTGLLSYGYGFGWGGSFQDYKSFHGRQVARTLCVGLPEVTAKVTVLEDLHDIPPGFFDAEATGGDMPLLQTVVVQEASLRKNLVAMEPVIWPALKDGPLDGAATAEIVVDRTGKVREVGPIVANNSGVIDVARNAIAAMHFSPYIQNGVAVQVVSRVSMPFKTTRPADVESFESARTYFERGRRVGFPAAGNGPPYVLHAVFKADVTGKLEEGQYIDTWQSDGEWRREASVGNSRFVRARHGEKYYRLAEGPDAQLLQLVLRVMEPIPAIDTFVESDWRIRRDTVSGLKTIRVLTGYEHPDGTLDPDHVRGFWFDDAGKLVKSYYGGIETRRGNFENFGGAEVARQVQVLHDGGLGMSIQVTDLSPARAVPANTFQLRGHEWTRAFTDEVR